MKAQAAAAFDMAGHDYGAYSLYELRPGAATATLLWLGTSGALFAYVQSLGSYESTYGSLAGVEEAFHTFLSSVPEDGLIIGCGDDPGVGRLLPRLSSRAERLLTYAA